jgi:hypothetical protein
MSLYSPWCAHIREGTGTRAPRIDSNGKPISAPEYFVRHDVLLEFDGERSQWFVDTPVGSERDIIEARNYAIVSIEKVISKGCRKDGRMWGRQDVIAFENPMHSENPPPFWDGNRFPFKSDPTARQYGPAADLPEYFSAATSPQAVSPAP